MRVIRGLGNIRPGHRQTVLTIGNFDGVHRGHQAVLQAVRDKAVALSLKSTVMIFEPQPLEFFAPGKAPARLTRLSEKLQAIQDCGIDQVLVIRFSQAFSLLSAEDFIRQILIDGLQVKSLYVGDDFCFGKQRQGTISTLRQAAEQFGFHVENLPTIEDEAGRFSSTRIRQHLEAGELQQAAHCLGRPYRICGRVAHGHKQGREIGYPTINIELHRNRSPLLGVYAVRVSGVGDDWWPGVASIGNRPVLDKDHHYLLEVHLFDFDREIYGYHVQVEFVELIRQECNFDSFDALRRQIDKDAAEARKILKKEAGQVV